MTQLKTSFAGLSLRNPVIISSSSLTNSAEKNKKLELAGAGAIVLKSVFEEQIMMQAHHMATYDSPEAGDYLSTYVRSHAIKEYIDLIQETKRLCTIPIIASINCFSSSEWTDFARTMQDAGADALELNILSLQTEKEYQYGAFEQRHIDILSSVKKHVSIPVIIKLGTNLTNPIALINQWSCSSSVIQSFLPARHQYRNQELFFGGSVQPSFGPGKRFALDSYCFSTSTTN